MAAEDAGEAPPEQVEVTFLTSGGRVGRGDKGALLLRISMRCDGGIPWKCGGGLCGTCRCLIEDGLDHAGPVTRKERKHLTPEEIAGGARMACQTVVTGPLAVSWVPLDRRRR